MPPPDPRAAVVNRPAGGRPDLEARGLDPSSRLTSPVVSPPPPTVEQVRQEWADRVRALVAETGLDYDFVEAFLYDHELLSSPRFPGQVDPRGLPMVQAGAELFGIAYLLKTYLYPFTPAGIIIDGAEAISGRDVLTGRELETWERLLAGASVLLPFVRHAKPSRLNAIGQAAQLARSLGSLAVKAARQLAHFAVSMRLSARATLRAIARFGKLRADKLAQILGRVTEAKNARRPLQLSDEDARFLRELDEAFKEFAGDTAAARSLAQPTMRAFMFLNRMQPLILGRLLGRTLGRPAGRLTSKALQTAEDTAADLASRIRAHWDAAVPRRQTALAAAQRVFGKLRILRPANPNTWIRRKLYDLWRARAMGRIYADTALVTALKRDTGIIIGKNAKTGTIMMHIRTKGPNGGRVQTPLDFDHAVVGHAEAVNDALRLNDARPLVSTIDGANLQLMTARENRNFIEALRKAEREMGTLVQRPQ